MASRVQHVTNDLNLPWLVYESENQVKGYAYATQWKTRVAYSRTVESTVYMAPNEFGNGIGTKLYQELLNKLMALGYHSILGGIALPNDASIALHEKLGFVKVGQLKEVGFKFNEWIDVGYWEYLVNK
jgi:phosphinothricin acetyltransferase